VVARDVPAAPVLDHARAAAELIPDRGLLAVSVVRSLDLIRARRDTEHERAWEVTRADRRELRAVARARHCHLSTPVMTMPRMNARGDKKKSVIGTMSDMTAGAWTRVG